MADSGIAPSKALLCALNGTYDSPNKYKKLEGAGVCLGPDKSKIPFKKIRDLKPFAVECTCQAACDQEPDCIGYSLRKLGGPYGVSCRVYGTKLAGLFSKAWDDLGSIGDPRYKGREIVAATDDKYNECFNLKERHWFPWPNETNATNATNGTNASAPAPAPAAASLLHQIKHSLHH